MEFSVMNCSLQWRRTTPLRIMNSYCFSYFFLFEKKKSEIHALKWDVTRNMHYHRWRSIFKDNDAIFPHFLLKCWTNFPICGKLKWNQQRKFKHMTMADEYSVCQRSREQLVVQEVMTACLKCLTRSVTACLCSAVRRDEKRFSFLLWISCHFFLLQLLVLLLLILSKVIFNDVLQITLPHLPTNANNLILLFPCASGWISPAAHSLMSNHFSNFHSTSVGMAFINPFTTPQLLPFKPAPFMRSYPHSYAVNMQHEKFSLCTEWSGSFQCIFNIYSFYCFVRFSRFIFGSHQPVVSPGESVSKNALQVYNRNYRLGRNVN